MLYPTITTGRRRGALGATPDTPNGGMILWGVLGFLLGIAVGWNLGAPNV